MRAVSHGVVLAPLTFGDTAQARVRPRELVPSEDNRLYVTAIRWRAWGGTVVRGRGLGHFGSCASAACPPVRYRLRRVAVALSRLGVLDGIRYYTRLRITPVDPALRAGRPWVDVVQLLNRHVTRLPPTPGGYQP